MHDIQLPSIHGIQVYSYRIKVVSTHPYYLLYLKEQTLLIFWSRTTGAYTSLFTNSIEAQQSRRSVVLFKEKSDYSQINTHFAEVAKRKDLNFGKPMNKLSTNFANTYVNYIYKMMAKLTHTLLKHQNERA